jgi:hypothetical protein
VAAEQQCAAISLPPEAAPIDAPQELGANPPRSMDILLNFLGGCALCRNDIDALLIATFTNGKNR